MPWTIKKEYAGEDLHGVKVMNEDGNGLTTLSVMPEVILSEMIARVDDRRVEGSYLVLDGLMYVPIEILDEA